MRNACIAGWGAIGPAHARALEHTENARLYAVCDIDRERLDLCRKSYDVKVFDDFSQMLGDTTVDTVHICTPHYLHYPMITKALEAGKSVIAEKPLTMTREEFDMLKKLKNADKICAVFQNRYNPCIQKLKKIADSGAYGKIKAVKAVLTWHRDAEYYRRSAWRGTLAGEGGGVLINQAVHTLDFMTYICGAAENVRADMMNYSLKNIIETEDTAAAYISFKNGASGMFFATNAYPVNSAPEFEVIFENKTFKYEYGRLMTDGETVETDKKPSSGKEYWGSGHELLIKNYYDKNKYFSVSDAEDTMNLMFAVYKSASENGSLQKGYSL